MEIVQKISDPILAFGDKIGWYIIPILIVLPIALVIFSKFSFNLFRIVLPIAGLAAGYFAGAKILTPLVLKFFTGFGVIKPEHVAGLICAIVFSFFCFTAQKATILAIGASVGYLVVGKLVVDLICKIGFVQQVISNTAEDKVTILWFMLYVVCACAAMYVFHKWFNFIYIYSTTLIPCAAAIAIPAMFIFKTTGYFETAVIVAACIGAAIGLVFGWIQRSKYKYFL